MKAYALILEGKMVATAKPKRRKRTGASGFYVFSVEESKRIDGMLKEEMIK